MANILITGGAGFIGGNFVRYWRKHYPVDELTVLDALTYSGCRLTLAGLDGVDLVVGDICDAPLVERLLEARSIDTIVHFAAESHVDRSIAAPDQFILTNVLGTHTLLKLAAKLWLNGSGREHRFHHVSTDEVYGSLARHDPAFNERTPYAPNSPYSASKAASDHLVRAYVHTYGLSATISNCSNNYGPFQFPEKLIPLFMLNGLFGLPLPIYGDGLNVRDWLHVEDHCRGIDAIVRRGRPGEVYNIGGGTERTNLEVVEEICRQTDNAFARDRALAQRFPKAPAAQDRPTSSLKSFVADRKGHDRRYAIDDRKIRDELGFAPTHNFTEGLADTLQWYLANETWWRQKIAKAAI